MKKRLVIGLGVLAAIGVLVPVGLALAQETPIGSILDDPQAGQGVTVDVTVADSTEPNSFVLEDASGQIALETGPAWFQEIALDVGQTITVNGEVDTGRDGTKPPAIDAFSIETADGTITVREGPGRPPWAGGPHVVGEKHPGYLESLQTPTDSEQTPEGTTTP